MRNNFCFVALGAHLESVDVKPMKTLAVHDNPVAVHVVTECLHLMEVTHKKLCIIKLTAAELYLNVTLQLQYNGQSEPRCHQFSVSVFDLGETLRFFDFPKGYQFYEKPPDVKFEGQEIPLSRHANPLFLRAEVCQQKDLRYVSTSNSVLIVMYFGFHQMKNLNLTIIARETACQAFTQFPLQRGFRQRLIENHTISEEPIVDMRDMDSSDQDALTIGLRLGTPIIYGIVLYLKTARITYYQLKSVNDRYNVYIVKKKQCCFVYQYAHNIYYSTWMGAYHKHIRLSIVDDEPSALRLTGHLISLQPHFTYIWIDNETTEYGFSATEKLDYTLITFQNNVNYTLQLTEVGIHRKQYLFDLICFMQSDQCRDIINLNLSYPITLPWRHLARYKVELLYKCYQEERYHRSLCMKENLSELARSMVSHTISCLDFVLRPIRNVFYWFSVPYHNRVIQMAYSNNCRPLTFNDEISVTKDLPTTVTLTWNRLPSTEIGYFGNPMKNTNLSATILRIRRTLLTNSTGFGCSIQVTIGKTVSHSILNKSNVAWKNNTYMKVPPMGSLSWNDAERLCKERGLEMFRPFSYAEEKFVVGILLSASVFSIPNMMFYGPTLKMVSLINDY